MKYGWRLVKQRCLVSANAAVAETVEDHVSDYRWSLRILVGRALKGHALMGRALMVHCGYSSEV